MTAPNKDNPVLCYVDGPWAYFTTQALEDAWGDDFDDAPYEHNAGTPYGPCKHEKFEIIKVAWDGDFETPSFGHCNSPWSVEQINAGAVAWLRTSRYSPGKPVVIPAGTTMERFYALIRKGGGTVYMANAADNRPDGPKEKVMPNESACRASSFPMNADSAAR